jgi:hypothetical protein
MNRQSIISIPNKTEEGFDTAEKVCVACGNRNSIVQSDEIEVTQLNSKVSSSLHNWLEDAKIEFLNYFYEQLVHGLEGQQLQ